MVIDFTALKRIAKATPDLTIAQFVAVWSEKIEDQRRATERERITEKRATIANTVPTTANNDQQPPTYAQRESELYRFGEVVCGKRAGGFVKTLLAANRNDIDATRRIFERAQQTHDARAFIAAEAGKVRNGRDKGPDLMDAFDRLDDRAAGGSGSTGAPLHDLTPGGH